jgi:UrcA family protein
MFRRFAVSALLPLAALVAVGAAEARTPDNVTVDVSYAGLDLSTPAGVAVFRGRVNQAVNEICGWTESRDLRAMRRLHQCRAALADQVEPRVTAQVDAAQDRATATATAAAAGASARQ